MSARRNRPGKHGTTPLADLQIAEEQLALDGARAAHAKGSVYWPPIAERLDDACERLIAKGVFVRQFYAYRIAGASIVHTLGDVSGPQPGEVPFPGDRICP